MSKIWLIMGLFSLNEVYLSSYIYFSFLRKEKHIVELFLMRIVYLKAKYMPL